MQPICNNQDPKGHLGFPFVLTIHYPLIPQASELEFPFLLLRAFHLEFLLSEVEGEVQELWRYDKHLQLA